MCNVNYISEFNAMMRVMSKNSLTGRERLLWIALFYAANDRAEYNLHTGERDWPTEFFPVPHSELNLLSTLNKKAIEEVRNSLKQRGLIDFRNGSRNKAAPQYKLYYQSIKIGGENDPNMYPSKHPSSAPSAYPNSDPNMGARSRSLLLNKRDTETEDQSGVSEDEEETNNLSFKPRTREITEYWKSCFGAEPTAAVADYLANFQFEHEFDNEIIDAVINRAALVNPSNVFDYLKTVLLDLSAKDVRHLKDLDNHFIEFKFAKIREQRRNRDEQYNPGRKLSGGS